MTSHVSGVMVICISVDGAALALMLKLFRQRISISTASKGSLFILISSQPQLESYLCCMSQEFGRLVCSGKY